MAESWLDGLSELGCVWLVVGVWGLFVVFGALYALCLVRKATLSISPSFTSFSLSSYLSVPFLLLSAGVYLRPSTHRYSIYDMIRKDAGVSR